MLLVVAGPAAAGSADAPEATDPAGDAGPNGAAAPAGFEDVDLVAVWWEAETADTITLTIATAGPSKGRVPVDYEIAFDAGGESWFAGYLNLPGPAGYVGSYVCPASNIPAGCTAVGGGVNGATVTAEVPIANFTAGDGVLAITGGRTMSFLLGPDAVVYDTSPAGLPYVLAAANATEQTIEAVLEAPAVQPAAANATTRADAAANETPLPVALALAALAAAGLRRRRS